MNLGAKIVSLASQERLDALGDRLSGAVDGALARLPEERRSQVADALHGKWLGHPLHPVLTDLPLGAWGYAGLLDALALAGVRTQRHAIAAAGAGILGAVPTALAGAMDWRHTEGEPRRLGVAHAALNGGALTLYITSMAMAPLSPGFARLLRFGGLGMVTLSAYLGGHLLASMRIGVKHEAQQRPSAAAIAVKDGRPDGAMVRIEVEGAPVLIVKQGGRTYALDDVCPHLGCSLSQGRLEDGAVVCPCHGSRFSLEDGRALRGPSTYAVAVYPTAAATQGDPPQLLTPETHEAREMPSSGE